MKQKNAYTRFQCLPFMQEVKPMWDLSRFAGFNGTVDFERKGQKHRPVHDYFIFYPTRVPNGDAILSMHLKKEQDHRKWVEEEEDLEAQYNERRLHTGHKIMDKTKSQQGEKVTLVPNHKVRVKLIPAIKQPAPWREKKRVRLTSAKNVAKKIPPWHAKKSR